MRTQHRWLIALASAFVACTPGAGATDGTASLGSDDDGTADDTSGSASSTGDDDPSAEASDDVVDDGSSEDEGEDEGGSSESGDPPPPPVGICDGDGTCSFPETCSTCPDECGSCDIDDLPDQRAKYVDQSCDQPGDGLVDECARSAGGPGRFVDLQVGLDSLVPGDTLFVHPGDYWRPDDAFRIQGLGTESAPIVITAAVPTDPPVLHSWDPAAPDDNSRSHPALGGAEQDISWIIVDNLVIDGLLGLHGDHARVQNVECRHGWEECDGNWSCIRLEWCTDCVAHHNYVHDVVDTTGQCTGGEYAPREAGFKEFDGVRTIWEFNTVADTAQWGYDLHRSSTDSIARYNLFRNAGWNTSIRMNRTANMSAYGNVVLGGGACIDFVNEDAGDGFANLIEHNTCLFTGAGLQFNGFAPATVVHNVFGWIGPGDADNVIIAAAPPEDGVPHLVDHNAYDDNSLWVTQKYDAPYAATLAEWQASTEYDDHSIVAPAGPCTFVDPPADSADAEFDLTIAEGECATLGDEGQPVGACALTACVGHDCSGCGF
jgi:hypothetical protein